MYQPDYKETEFDLYVPAGAEYGIDPASAIVAGKSYRDQERVLVYYESNRFGAENVVTYKDRAQQAAGRAAMNYPTIAKSMLPASELIRVGSYDLVRNTITEISAPDALQAWLGDRLPMPQVG